MEILVLNRAYHINNGWFYPLGLLQNYTSMKWVEHYRGKGSVEVKAPYNKENERLLAPRNYLRLGGSYRLMRIHKVETGLDAKGLYIKASGPSLEYILSKRVVNFAGRVQNDVINGLRNVRSITASSVAVLANSLVQSVCVDQNWGDTSNKIDRLVPLLANRLGVSSLPVRYKQFVSDFPDHDPVQKTNVINPGVLSTIIDGFLQSYNIGYAILMGDIDDDLGFSVYTGRDRSKSVVFDPELDTLDSVTEIVDITDYLSAIEVATVNSANGLEIGMVVSPGEVNISDNYFPRYTATSSRTRMPSDDFDRFIGIETMDRDQYDRMEQEIREDPEIPNLFPHTILRDGVAREAFKDRTVAKLAEGEVNRNTRFVYERDYTLTDIVSLNTPKNNYKARVISNTVIIDEDSYSSYPTLEFIDGLG